SVTAEGALPGPRPARSGVRVVVRSRAGCGSDREAMDESPQDHRWAVVLAGGEGLRVRPLTRLLSGDDRPKQFCAFSCGQSLLAHTRRRIARAISAERTFFSLLRSHEIFFTKELGNVSPAQLIVQPANRGTLSAILYSLVRVLRADKCATVAFFPCDHYF